MFKFFKLRLDTCSSDICNKIVKMYSPSDYIWSFEKVGTSDQHAHFYLKTDKPSRNIREYIQRHVGMGNGIYSLVELDQERPIEYCAYVTKERHYTTNMPEDVISEFLKYDDAVKQSMKEKKAAKKTQYQLLEIDYQAYLLTTKSEDKVYDYDPSVICLWIINWHKINGKMIRKGIIECLLDTLLVNYHDYGHTLANNICRFK